MHFLLHQVNPAGAVAKPARGLAALSSFCQFLRLATMLMNGFRGSIRACGEASPRTRQNAPSLQSHGPYNNSAHLEPFSLFSVSPRHRGACTMTTPETLRNIAADCQAMAKIARSTESKATWGRLVPLSHKPESVGRM